MRDESPTLGKLAAALAKAQGSIRNAAKETMNNNPHVNKKYADLGSVWDACRSALAENELAVTQRVTTDGEEVTLTTMLLHSSGEFLRDRLVVRVSPIGSQPWIQALGISITYARRYALSALVGVAPAGDDTDGEGSQASAPSSRKESRGDGPTTSAPTTFPPFGKAKGEPIRDATLANLEWYLSAALKSVDDPERSRFRAANQALVDAIEAELLRRREAASQPSDQMMGTGGAAPKPRAVVDLADGETEEHAKQRTAGLFYDQAVKLGAAEGWEQPDVGKWLRTSRGRTGKTEVTAADVAEFAKHLTPPPEPGAGG